MNTPTTKRFRRAHAVGSLDSNSDEELDIEVSATSTPGRISIAHQGFPSKRLKTQPTEDQIFTTTLTDSGGPNHMCEGSNPVEEKKRNQGASVMMAIFAKEFHALQESILLKSYHPNVGRKCQCGKSTAVFRYTGHDYCFQADPLCQTFHMTLPFHRIEQWNGTHFKATSLNTLGYVLHLGHAGQLCPNVDHSKIHPRQMVVVHTNGFHKFSVCFCSCYHAPRESTQLSNAQLFPATMEHPQTAFSFAVLDNFHQLTLSSKKSLYDYHDALVKLTDPVFPQDVPHRYTEMSRIFRVWIHLAALRRRGQVHDIDDIMQGHRKDSLAIRCPACPEVHVNVDAEAIKQAQENEVHKYILFISADGNFRLQRKHKKEDPDDVALNEGRSYFVESVDYKTYLTHAGETPKENGVCGHLRANRLQNVIKFKNAVVSGVIAIVCARHGFYLPQGMVDLSKGESFVNTDYALAHSLADAEDLRWIMLSYDIWCSYYKNLKRRFSKCLPDAEKLLDNIRGAILKMHIRNHVEACQLLWAFNYLEYSGETCGELIETGWSEGNQAAGSTKEMNDGHRHDMLDEYHGYWNWTKLHRLATSLYGAYNNCLGILRTRETYFRELEKSINPEHLARWSRMDDVPRQNGKHVISVHVAKYKNGPPTQGKAYKALMAAEVKTMNTSGGTVGAVHFINTGLHLERDQFKILAMLSNKYPTSTQLEAIKKARCKLQRDLVMWRQSQLIFCPPLRSRFGAVDSISPEKEALMLPSSFDQCLREHFGLTSLALTEYKLREGQAYDALEDLREKIKIFNANLDFKKTNVFGQGANTRAQTFLSQLSADKISAAEKYRVARRALIALGLPASDAALQELHDNQLYGKDMSRTARMGDSKRADPWFWTVGTPSGLTPKEQSEWSLELDRVKYFRDRSACNRAREEKEILESEMARMSRSFMVTYKAWSEIGKREKEKNAFARAAYAYKQAEIYGRLAEDSKAIQAKAEKKDEIYQRWFKN